MEREMHSLAELIDDAFDHEPADTRDRTHDARDLLNIFEKMQDRHDFKPGDLITHKWPDMATSKNADGVAVVLEVLPEAIVVAAHPEAFEDVTDWFSNATPAVFDIKLAYIEKGGSLAMHFANSSEYRPYDGPVTGAQYTA